MNKIMSVRPYFFVMAIIAAVFFALDAMAAEGNPVYGKKVYENKCASCHGIKGDYRETAHDSVVGLGYRKDKQ